jgi:hypothetical protein
MLIKQIRTILAIIVACLMISCSSGNKEKAVSDSATITTTATATPMETSTPTPTATPKPTPHPAAVAALKSLRKMAGAAQMGINFQEYSSRIIDAKADVDESLAQLPNGEVKKEIALALQAYVDAKTIWNDAATSDSVFTFLEPAKTLQRKYKIPERQKGTATDKSVALSTIWSAASKHIERASKVLNE